MELLGGHISSRPVINNLVLGIQKVVQELNIYLVRYKPSFPEKMRLMRALVRVKSNFQSNSFLIQLEKLLLIIFSTNPTSNTDKLEQLLNLNKLVELIIEESPEDLALLLMDQS
jgi:hypothetical protein